MGRSIREPAARGREARDWLFQWPIGLIVVLFTTFGSARQALLILGNVPFALVGGIVALWLSGEYLSVTAAVGFIALLGIAVLQRSGAGVALQSSAAWHRGEYRHGRA